MRGSVTSKRVYELRESLGEREWEIIGSLARVRVATSSQLIDLHLSGVGLRRAQRILTALVQRRVLARLPRTIGGPSAGSLGHVYVLDVAGQRLADLADGGRVRRPWAMGTRFLAHSLAVTDVYVRLVRAERAGSLRLARFAGEPASWRSFVTSGGGRAVLKPDAYAVVLVGGWEDHWFIEVDLDTEHVPAIASKCAVYRGYWQSGAEEARTGVFPRVLWLVPDEPRAHVIREVIRRQPGDAIGLFDVALSRAAVGRIRRGAGS